MGTGKEIIERQRMDEQIETRTDDELDDLLVQVFHLEREYDIRSRQWVVAVRTNSIVGDSVMRVRCANGSEDHSRRRAIISAILATFGK